MVYDGYIPARVRELSCSGPIAGALIQHDADIPVSVTRLYTSRPSWPCTSRPKGVTDEKWDYGVGVQRSNAQSQPQKGRNWYLEKYRRANPKKKGVDSWRSTNGQTPKRKELIFGEVQTGKPQKGRSWYLEKYKRANPEKEWVDI